MPTGIIGEALFGDYLARKKREQEVKRRQALRPEEELDRGLEEESQRRLAVFKNDQALDFARRQQKLLSEGKLDAAKAEADLFREKASDPFFASTDTGAQGAKNSASSARDKVNQITAEGELPSARETGENIGKAKAFQTFATRKFNEGTIPGQEAFGGETVDTKREENRANGLEAAGRSRIVPSYVAKTVGENNLVTDLQPIRYDQMRSAGKLATETSQGDLNRLMDHNLDPNVDLTLATDRATALRAAQGNKAGVDLSARGIEAAATDPSPITLDMASTRFGPRPISPGEAVLNVYNKPPYRDVIMTKDAFGNDKPVAVQTPGGPVPIIGKRLLPKAASVSPGTNGVLKPADVAVGAPLDEGPSSAQGEKLKDIEPPGGRGDYSEMKASNWETKAHKDYGIKDSGLRAIEKLFVAISQEIKTGIDAVSGERLSPKTIGLLQKQQLAISNILNRKI